MRTAAATTWIPVTTSSRHVSSETLEHLLAGFDDGSLPKEEWTHTAHLAVGTWHVHRYGADEALRRLRNGILSLNHRHGTPNTDAGGYHETITRAYVWLIADFLTTCSPAASAAECSQALLRSPLAASDVLLTYYSRARLMSTQARRGWVEPDVRRLSARLLCRPTILDGGEAFVRRFREADAPALVSMLMDPALMKWALEDRAFDRAEAEMLIETHFRQPASFGFGTICLKGGDEPIGFGGYRRCRYLGADDLEFGWVIARDYQTRGYATAVGRRLIEHALDVLRLPRVLAACHPAHVASEHILRDKLRMEFERDVRVGPHRRRLVYAARRRTR